MSNWTTGELDAISASDELQIAALRPGGSLRPYPTIWVVRVGDDLYVRSYGTRWDLVPVGAATTQGRIRAAGIDRDVTFTEPDRADHDAIDQAYKDKYAGYASTYVDPMISPGARAATLQLTPR